MEENTTFQLSKSVGKIYEELARLEKEKDTQKWEEMFSILVLSQKYENKDYIHPPKEQELEQVKGIIKESYFGDFIFELTPSILSSIRILNKSGTPSYSLLYPYSMEEDFYKMMNKVHQQSYVLIDSILQTKDITEEERNLLIDYKYALLITTPSLERYFLAKEKPFWTTNTNLKENEIKKMTQSFFSEVSEEINKISLWKDEDLSPLFLLELLILKAKLGFFDPLYLGTIYMELSSSLSLIEILGALEGKNVQKLVHYIDYFLLNFSNFKQK